MLKYKSVDYGNRLCSIIYIFSNKSEMYLIIPGDMKHHIRNQ